MDQKVEKKLSKVVRRIKRRSKSKGIALLELSIIITSFLTLSFGTVSLGKSMYEISIALEATKHASRVAAIEAFNTSGEYCEVDHVATKGCIISRNDDLVPRKLFDTSTIACNYLTNSHTTSTKWDMTTYLEPLAVGERSLESTEAQNPNYSEGHGIHYDKNQDGRVDPDETDLITRYVVRVVGLKEKNQAEGLGSLFSIMDGYNLRTDSAYLTEASCA